MKPLMPSPGSPKIVSTPQSMRRSARTSEAVWSAIGSSCESAYRERGGARGGQPQARQERGGVARRLLPAGALRVGAGRLPRLRQPEHLGQVQRAPPGGLANLFAAAEAVGDEQCFWRRLADGGEDHPL